MADDNRIQEIQGTVEEIPQDEKGVKKEDVCSQGTDTSKEQVLDSHDKVSPIHVQSKEDTELPETGTESCGHSTLTTTDQSIPTKDHPTTGDSQGIPHDGHSTLAATDHSTADSSGETKADDAQQSREGDNHSTSFTTGHSTADPSEGSTVPIDSRQKSEGHELPVSEIGTSKNQTNSKQATKDHPKNSSISGTEIKDDKSDEVRIPREFEPLWGILSQIPKKAQRGLLMQCDLILTCVSADETYILLGTNIGLVFLYDRNKQTMERLRTETPSDVVTCVQLHRGLDYQLAVGMASGAVCMFLLPSMTTGLNKQLQKFDVRDMHRTYLTCVEWSTNGMRLFSGDKSGTVVTTEVDFYQGQCKSSILLIEAHAEIVQLHYDHKVILVSTRQRSLICRLDDRDRITQVGQQERKVLGGFGATFIPGLCKISDAELYASRPGCRIWRAGIDGTVRNTSMFKDLIGSPNTEIPLFKPEKTLITQEPQFGKVHIYRGDQLVTWTPLGLFLLDPVSNVVIAHSDKLGYIADVSICNDEIFILRRNVETSLIRLAERAEAPLVKSILSSVQHGNSPYRSTVKTFVSQNSPVFQAEASAAKPEKESKHMSPGSFFKKNFLGKFNKLLDLKSDSRQSREAGLQQEVSVKQLIDDDYVCADGHNCDGGTAAITSPDLPPVVRINSPELTALQVYAGMAGSPMSPESGQEIGQINTYCAKTGESITQDSPGGSTSPDGVHEIEIANHLSLIAERVHVSPPKKTGDIVFTQKPKKHKRKKHKAEKSRHVEEDQISQHSDTSQSEPAIATEETAVDTLQVADEILRTTSELLKSDSTEESVQRQESRTFDSIGSSLQQSPAATPSSESSEFDPISVPYAYKVDESSLPDVSNTDFRSHRLGQMARDLSSGYGTESVQTVSTDVSGQDPSLNSDAQSPLTPASAPEKSRDKFYTTSDTSTEDFYKKYRSQSSLDSSVTSPAAKLPSPEPESEQSASPEDVAAPLPKADVAPDEKVAAGTLLKLANSWSEIITPTNVYSLVLSESHVWFTDKSENIYYSTLSGAKGVVWRKASGQARQIAVSSSGVIVWRLHKNTVYAGTKLTSRRPEGMKWVEAVKDVTYISVDDTCAWYIKVNGDVMIQKGLSVERPCFKSVKIDGRVQLKQVACRAGVVWGITENHRLVYRSGVTEACPEGTEWKQWGTTDGILFASVAIGDQGTGWAVDVVGRIWFCCDVSMETPCGNDTWWQVPMSEYFVQDATALDALRSLASKFDPQKLSYLLSTSRGGLITAGPQGVWVCLEYKNILHVCRGSFQGYSWQDAHPQGMAPSTVWKTVSANISDLEWGLVWAQQPNGELYVFPSDTRKALLISPSPMFTCLHAGPIAVWGMDHTGKVWVRAGMGPFCPQGATWSELDLSQLGDSQLIHVSCNSQYVWTVDCNGMVYQRIGAKAPTDQQLSPAWLPIDSFSEITFTQVVTGALEWMVWAIDNRRLGYVRQGITDRMPIGREWVHIPGTQIVELTVTKTGVWALNPHGEVLYRYGITRDNVCGNYWKKVPGVFTHLSASPNDDLWAISREGHLLQCRTKYLQRRQTSNDPLLHRTLSTGSEEGEGEWELV